MTIYRPAAEIQPQPVTIRIFNEDCRAALKNLDSGCVHCVVTSPPYFGLRDYDVDGQIGLEQTPEEYVAEMVAVFREVRRVLRDDGTLWLNLGDSYAGSWGAQGHRESSTNDQRISRHQIANHPKRASRTGTIRQAGLKAKDRMMIPAQVALALRSDGWWLRDEIIWRKPNPMPLSVTDRTTPSHEMIYMLSKSRRYFYDQVAVMEDAVSTHPSGNGFARPQQIAKGGRGKKEQWLPTEKRNRRSVWDVPVRPFKEAHFATFPPDLIEPCILAGCPAGGTVLDPFFGAGTTGLVAQKHGRNCIGIELNPEYIDIAKRRLGLTLQPVGAFG